MSYEASNGQNDGNNLAQAFNSVCEVEIKLLAPIADAIDSKIFSKIKNHFASAGWILSSRENIKLLTRQLDTPSRKFEQRNASLRIRGESNDNTLQNIDSPDICLKQGKSFDQSGAVRREEYQARIESFDVPDMSALQIKYPAKDFPALHATLSGIRHEELVEFFRIDCDRNRYLVELPEDVHGIKGKRFVAELILDHVKFVFDPLPGTHEPVFFHCDMEVECEAMLAPCDYDRNPNAARNVSSPMSASELNQAMSAVRNIIENAAGNVLTPNADSKAERGFAYFDHFTSRAGSKLVCSTMGRENSVITAFNFVAHSEAENNIDNSTLVERDFSEILRARPLAFFAR